MLEPGSVYEWHNCYGYSGKATIHQDVVMLVTRYLDGTHTNDTCSIEDVEKWLGAYAVLKMKGMATLTIERIK